MVGIASQAHRTKKYKKKTSRASDWEKIPQGSPRTLGMHSNSSFFLS
jgi:hypothetical protein